MTKYFGYCEICDEKKELYDYNHEFLCKSCLNKIKGKVNPPYKRNKEQIILSLKKNELSYSTKRNGQDSPTSIHKLDEKGKSCFNLLTENTKEINEFEGILKELPKFYLLLCNIVSDKKSDWYTRILVNSALSYLVLEEDIIPDKLGNKGYLDDLFLCAYVLKEIRDKISKEIISHNLQGINIENNEEIFDLIYHVFSKSSEYLGERTEEILSLVGLSKFNLFDLMYLDDKSIQLTKYKKKKKLIYAMLAVKAKQVFSTMNGTLRLEHLKSYLKEHPEFVEITHFMEFGK